MAGIDQPAALRALIRVIMRDGRPLVTAGAPEHPDRHADDQPAGNQLEIGLGGLGVPLRTVTQRDGGERPDDQRVRERGRQSQQHRLKNRPTDRDDERGHHRLRMPRLHAMQGPQQDGGRNEEPGVGGALVHEVIK